MKKTCSGVQFQEPFFDPWVGSNYGCDGIQKVMIVGASHYCEESGAAVDKCPCGCGKSSVRCRGMTRKVIHCYLTSEDRTGWVKTYTKFINSLYGREATQTEREVVLDHVVFMNYLQRVEGSGSGEKHNEYFKAPCHFHAFCNVVLRYRPDVVIVWGDRVWRAMLDSICEWNNEAEMDWQLAKSGLSADVRISDFTFKMLSVYHPSYCGYETADNPHERFKKFGVVFPSCSRCRC